MPLRTEVTSFNFFATAGNSADKRCNVDIAGVSTRLLYKVEGETAFDSNEFLQVGGVGGGQFDPVTTLRQLGWEVSKWVGRPGAAGQPAGFTRAAEFRSLSLKFEAPVICQCQDPPKTNNKKLRLAASYDRESNAPPKSTVHEMDATGADGTKLAPKTTRTAPTSTPGENKSTTIWEVEVPCPCSDDSKPCLASFGVEYTYRTVTVPD